MAKFDKPENSETVFTVMVDYCKTKQFNLPDAEIRFMAEDCFLFFESKGWKDTKYWPALAMRWCLTSMNKIKSKGPGVPYKARNESKPIHTVGKTVRQTILEQGNLEE